MDSGRILTCFGLVWENRCCHILSVNGACPSLVTSVMLVPIKTIPDLFRPVLSVLYLGWGAII